jgi:AcrR family transcriptional regulator
MAIPEANLSSTRSDARIPKLRTRGRANRQKMLDVAERMTKETGSEPIRFSDVFEEAKVSRGSAYRIYNGIDDLMQDLASALINKFVSHIRNAGAGPGISTWMQLSDRILESTAAYWRNTEEMLRVLPRVRSNVPESYKQAAKDMNCAVADIFERHFVVPAIPDWIAVIGMYTQIGDAVFSDAVRRDGYISASRLLEAQKLCSTYLTIYLPSSLPLRASGSTD